MYTSADMLAMAKGAPNDNDSQFFITNTAQPAYDFAYTIVGFMIQGDAFRAEINNPSIVPTTYNSTTTFDQPTYPVVIDSMTLLPNATSTQDTALELSARPRWPARRSR